MLGRQGPDTQSVREEGRRERAKLGGREKQRELVPPHFDPLLYRPPEGGLISFYQLLRSSSLPVFFSLSVA
jgi:hypothetical protein